jgi:hypothetical protein
MFEIFQYRSVLAQIRRGASDRELARGHAMGRRKLAQFRALAAVQGLLDAEAPLPDEAQIAAALKPHCQRIERGGRWWSAVSRASGCCCGACSSAARRSRP